jgi:hypothetical protein
MKLVHARFVRKSSKSKNINWKTGFIDNLWVKSIFLLMRLITWLSRAFSVHRDFRFRLYYSEWKGNYVKEQPTRSSRVCMKMRCRSLRTRQIPRWSYHYQWMKNIAEPKCMKIKFMEFLFVLSLLYYAQQNLTWVSNLRCKKVSSIRITYINLFN